MPFLKIFKRLQPTHRPPVKRAPKPEKKKIKPEKEVRVEKPIEAKPPKTRKETRAGEAYRVLKIPHIAEKATTLTGGNQYVFRVYSWVNKKEIKKAIEDVFGVDVIGVKIINIPKKKRRLGKYEGFRKGYKKAIVRIKEGQKIEVLPR